MPWIVAVLTVLAIGLLALAAARLAGLGIARLRRGKPLTKYDPADTRLGLHIADSTRRRSL